MNTSYFLSLFLLFLISDILFAVPNCELAFEGAEGYGACSQGGKGGTILEVNTLEDSGSKGSLRWAIEQSGPRIVVFKIDGIISLNDGLSIKNPYITIDGSTAPGKGITIKNGTIHVESNNVIIRYLKVRPGDEVNLSLGKREKNKRPPKRDNVMDAISIDKSQNVILDHISASWSCDEIISVMNSENVTVQWSIMTEPLANPKLHIENGKEISHPYGSQMGGKNISYIKNIFSNYQIRGPQMVAPDDKNVIAQLFTANNIIAFYSGSGTRLKFYGDQVLKHIVTNNIYLAPLKNNAPPIELLYGDEDGKGHVNNMNKAYIDNNILPNKLKQRDNDWRGVSLDKIDQKDVRLIKSISIPFKYPSILNLLPPERVIEDLLPSIGASLPYRDRHDIRIVDQIESEIGGRIINGQDDVGGYEE